MAMPLEGTPGTVGEVARRASSTLPADLVSPVQLDRVAAIGDLVPVRLAPSFGFEFRLDEGDRVDCAFAITEREPALAHFEAMLEAHGAEAPAKSRGGWERLCELLRVWCDPASVVGQGLRVLMLEFDADGSSGDPLPAPLVFWHASKDWGADDPRHLELFTAIVEILVGGRWSPRGTELVERSFELGYLQSDGVEPVFGLAASRDPAPVRAQLAGLDRRQILAAAEGVGWPGSLSALERLLEQAGDPVTRELAVAFDITDRVLPRLGVEFVRLSGAGSLEPALAYLDSLGLVTPAKFSALSDLGDAWQVFGTGEGEFLQRRMNHYKASIVDDRVVGAKGYLRYGYHTSAPESPTTPPVGGP